LYLFNKSSFCVNPLSSSYDLLLVSLERNKPRTSG
jgi:hypothetical protein